MGKQAPLGQGVQGHGGGDTGGGQQDCWGFSAYRPARIS